MNKYRLTNFIEKYLIILAIANIGEKNERFKY